jgi:Cu2+-containing amine oxidase
VNAICVWEQPDNIGIMRHIDNDFYGGTDGYTYAAGSPRTTLVVRTTSTVYNYDYYYSYIFYAEGSVKVDVAASGYLQSDAIPSTEALRRPEARYQTPVRQRAAGNLHDHLFSYKVDLDVLGTSNSLVRSEIKVGRVELPWNFDGNLRKMKYVDSKVVQNEGSESVMNVDPSKPVKFKFIRDADTRRTRGARRVATPSSWARR